jgi:hypothetical protein
MTISSTNRKAGPYIGNGTAATFAFSFKVFQASDLEVVKLTVSTSTETTLALTTDYTVTLNADQNSNAGGSITLVAGALAAGYNLVITSDIANLQQTDLTNQGGFYPEVITQALDRATIQIQQLQEGLDRAAQLPITSAEDADALVADIMRIADSADNIDTVATNISSVNTVATNISNVNTVAGNNANVTTVAGISANVTSVAGNSTNINAVAGNSTNINAVNSNSTNINTVAGIASNVTTVASNNSNVTTVATNIASVNSAATNMAAIIDAPTQAASAAASAAAAAASVASGLYSAVQDKSANYTVALTDAGDLLRVTTTSGAITITLPLISGLPDGFKIAIVKWSADSNAVNIARSGSDTINGATSASIGLQYTQTTFVADLETNQWFASTSGLGATNVVVDAFNGTGSQTAFTLSGDPSVENNTYVYVSGVYQSKATYSLSGTTLTFSTAPPSGTANIEVVWTQPLSIGTPSDGTVTPAKLSTGGPSWTSSGNLTTAGTVAMGSSFLRNKLINGNMYVAQRATSATVTAGTAVPTISAGYPCVDRWFVYSTGANVTAAQVAGAGSNKNLLQVTGAASVTAVGIGQRIEQLNSYDLAGQTCTLSVNIANSLLTTVTWTASYATTTADTFGTIGTPTKTQIATGTFTVTSTLTQYTANIAVPAAATTGIEILFTVGAQTSGTWQIGNAQFEVGTVATSFERQIFSNQLSMCQRYYQTMIARVYMYAGSGPANLYSPLIWSAMRATPVAATISAGLFANTSAIQISPLSPSAGSMDPTITAAGYGGASTTFSLSSEIP